MTNVFRKEKKDKMRKITEQSHQQEGTRGQDFKMSKIVKLPQQFPVHEKVGQTGTFLLDNKN